VFALFGHETAYFGKPEQSWIANFRVADLEAMVAQLCAAGIAVEEPQSYPSGILLGCTIRNAIQSGCGSQRNLSEQIVFNIVIV